MPFAAFDHNQAWLELSLIAQEPAALGGRFAWRESSRSPSPSGCASACCTSPRAWCARVGG